MSLRPLNPKRNYGIDALRIISMLMIAVHHIITHGGLEKSRPMFSVSYDALVTLDLAVLCAVNCYVLISGYVGVYSRHKYSSLAALWLQVFFYSAGITVLFYFIKPQTVTLRVFVRSLIPVLSREYWFFSCYFVMFLFVPVLNLAIEHLSRRRLEILLLSLMLIIGIGSTVYHDYYAADTLNINRGYSPWWMMVLYMAGGYIRKYDIFKNTKKIRFLLVFIVSVALSAFLKLSVQQYTFDKYGKLRYNTLFFQYNSVNICICALALFLFFRNLHLKTAVNRVIAFLAPMTFSVYLIHDHPLTRNQIVKKELVFMQKLSAPLMILSVAGMAVGIYLSCSLIDLVRLNLFKWLKVKPRLEKLEAFIGKKLHKA